MDHPVRYTKVDGLNLAYQVVGDGPIDLVMVDEWATPLEGRWMVPAIAGRLNRLASFARLISFDKRGIGLSDTGDPDRLATPELWVRDLVAVVDAVGSERPVIFGAHEGGPIALMYAASLPTRTDSLVLVNTGPRLLDGGPSYPFGNQPELWQPDLEGIVEVWESGSDSEGQISATAHDPWWREWYARSRRQQATPNAGLALLRMIGQVDVRHILPAVQAPTLVLHREGNSWWPIGGARWMADQMAAASFVELAGTDNYWWSGDADAVVDEIEQFLLGERVSEQSQRELATMVFTDVVDSTQRTSEVGDSEWRKLLDVHDTTIMTEVERYGGTVIKNLGDGFFLSFDGPAAAIMACIDLRNAIQRLGLPLRIAIHTGEVERRSGDLTGLAVNLTSRLLGVAEPGEIIVSGVVRGLVAGSGIRFSDRGLHRFRGIPDEWDAHRVEG